MLLPSYRQHLTVPSPPLIHCRIRGPLQSRSSPPGSSSVLGRTPSSSQKLKVVLKPKGTTSQSFAERRSALPEESEFSKKVASNYLKLPTLHKRLERTFLKCPVIKQLTNGKLRQNRRVLKDPVPQRQDHLDQLVVLPHVPITTANLARGPIILLN